MKLKLFHNFPLRGYLLSTLSVTIIIVGVIMILGAYFILSNHGKKELDKLGTILIEDLAKTTTSHLTTYNYFWLRNNIKNYQYAKDIYYAAVYDDTGRLVAYYPEYEMGIYDYIPKHNTNQIESQDIHRKFKRITNKRGVLYSKNVFDKGKIVGRVSIFLTFTEIETAVNKMVMYLSFFGIVAFILLLSIISYFVKKCVGPVSKLAQIMKSYPIEKSEIGINKNPIKEVNQLYSSFQTMSAEIEQQKEKLAEAIAHTEIAKNARQVSHDIRSPLASLQAVVSMIDNLPEEQRTLMRSAVQRIGDIANNLESRNVDKTKINSNLSNELTTCLLSAHLDTLISEKRIEYRVNSKIEIVTEIDEKSYGLFSRIQPIEFKRLLSNLINNAVQSLDGNKGRVIVSLKLNGTEVELIITDNGKGIPKEILEELGREGATFGKSNGKGLGLYHARKNIELWGGRISIESKQGEGTSVVLSLPKVASPSWFLPHIRISEDTKIIVIDDDDSIHKVWDSLFATTQINQQQIYHFSNSKDVNEFYRSRKESNSYLFLCDFELRGDEKDGLDIISENGISSSSILVTSRYEEASVRERCKNLGVKLLPKGLAGFVPIFVEGRNIVNILKGDLTNEKVKYDAVLIDDQKIVRDTWALVSKMKKKKLKVYSHPSEFFVDADRIQKDTMVYIDSHLSEDIKGELIAKEIKKLGFERIYLATGSDKNEFSESMPWITAIRDKLCPFIDA